MNYRKLGKSDLEVSPISLGTWAFGGDNWWGPQQDSDSVAVLDYCLAHGINIIDTAPVYGRGRSERVIGAYIRKRNARQKVILATKFGLSWQGSKINHDLSKKRILEEVDKSRSRLETDYFDLYQVHWPDPDTQIGETAECLYSLHQKGIVKAMGASNYSVEQMEEFSKYCPLHSLQPEYSMFKRDIETEIVPYCLKNEIAIISYAPLYSGLLTGKFFFEESLVPQDTNRQLKSRELTEPLLSLNRAALSRLKEIAAAKDKTLAQLAISWNFSRPGITSAIVGMRHESQARDNLGALDTTLSEEDLQTINNILEELSLDKKNALKAPGAKC